MEDTEGLSDGVLFPGGYGVHVQDILPSAWPIRRVREDPLMGTAAWAQLERLGGPVDAPVHVITQDDMTRPEAEALAAAAAKALARCAEIEDTFGRDQSDGAVIRFTASFGHRDYSYAAIRGGGHWYVTGGKSPQHCTWDQLTRWLFSNGVREIERLADGFIEEIGS